MSKGKTGLENNEVVEHKRSDIIIRAIGRDNTINTLIHCSRSYYGVISSINSSFRSLIRSGELYKL